MVFLTHLTHKKKLIAKYATLQRLTPVKYEMYFIVTRISSLRSIDVYFLMLYLNQNIKYARTCLLLVI